LIGGICKIYFVDLKNITFESPAGHGFTAMVERETMTDKHPKIGRVSQSGVFFCYIPGLSMECGLTGSGPSLWERFCWLEIFPATSMNFVILTRLYGAL